LSPQQLEIQLITAVVAAACALVGSFLVLRRQSMLADAVSHAILPGIVLAFFWTESLTSPLLLIAAAGTGVVTVFLIEALERTRLVKTDAAIGLVFPALFALGVVLVARYASDVHLDTDAVLLGDPAFSWIERFAPAGRDLGPLALWTMGGVLLLNLAFVAALFKELKLATFDAALAGALGFAPALMHYALAALVSITAVGAFDVVGSVLVVALMVAPPSAAYLLTDRLPRMIGLAVLIGVLSAVLGYALARAMDASIAGSMAAAAGGLFLLAFLFARERGLLAQARRGIEQRREFARRMLAVHLLHHERTAEADEECRVRHLEEHLQWTPAFAERAVRQAVSRGTVRRQGAPAEAGHSAGPVGDRLSLTPAGRRYAQDVMVD
jgi:manganese/zinc/iron transport system permease protein